MKALSILSEVTNTLKTHDMEFAEKEAEFILRQGLNIDIVKIYRDNPILGDEQIRILDELLHRRLQHEPVQYILGYEEFLGLRLKVGPGVLIPRPETELMAEYAIKTVKSEKLKVKSYEDKDSSLITHHLLLNILDIGTGSGCLALALAWEFPDAQVYGTDISETAIEYAKENAEINCINNVTFLKGNLFEPIEELAPCLPKRVSVRVDPDSTKGRFDLPLACFDLIISNPPYIKTEDIKDLQPEVWNWEPAVALDGGIDGLDFYRRLLPTARRFLKDNGTLMLEVGLNQSDDIAQMLRLSGYSEIEIINDYAGIERIIHAIKR